MAFRMTLAVDENVNILDLKCKNPSFSLFLLPPRVYEKAENNTTFPSFLSI